MFVASVATLASDWKRISTLPGAVLPASHITIWNVCGSAVPNA